MNEMLFYISLALGIMLFILSVVLFITQHIPTAIKYLLAIKKNKAFLPHSAGFEKKLKPVKQSVSSDSTALLEGAEETAILGADRTTLLTQSNWQEENNANK